MTGLVSKAHCLRDEQIIILSNDSGTQYAVKVLRL